MSSKRNTVYFISENHVGHGADDASKAAIKKRDAFLRENESKIAEIVHEQIEFYNAGLNNSLFACISLSYYEKETP